MADFIGEDLSGSRFERVNLAGSRFERIILSGAEIRASDIVDTRFRGVEMSGDQLASGSTDPVWIAVTGRQNT